MSLPFKVWPQNSKRCVQTAAISGIKCVLRFNHSLTPQNTGWITKWTFFCRSITNQLCRNDPHASSQFRATSQLRTGHSTSNFVAGLVQYVVVLYDIPLLWNSIAKAAFCIWIDFPKIRTGCESFVSIGKPVQQIASVAEFRIVLLEECEENKLGTNMVLDVFWKKIDEHWCETHQNVTLYYMICFWNFTSFRCANSNCGFEKRPQKKGFHWGSTRSSLWNLRCATWK